MYEDSLSVGHSISVVTAALRRAAVARNHRADGRRGRHVVRPAAEGIQRHPLGHLGWSAEQGTHHLGHRKNLRERWRRLYDQQFARREARVSFAGIYGLGKDGCSGMQEARDESLD